MSQHAEYSEFNLMKPHRVSNGENVIAFQLAEDGIKVEKWKADLKDSYDSYSDQKILDDLADKIAMVKNRGNYQHVDIARIDNNNSHSVFMRGKYLSEHTHTEDEVRFYLEGSVLMYFHINQRVHILHCEKGDFVTIPKGVKHWLDVGPEPNFTCLRWYNTPEGLTTKFSGSTVAEATARWETIFSQGHFSY